MVQIPSPLFKALVADPWAWLVTIVVAVVYPILGYVRFRKLASLPVPLSTATRLRTYAGIVVSQWFLVVLAAVVVARHGANLAALGETLGSRPGVTLGAAIALLVVYGVLAWLTLRALKTASESSLPSHVRRAGRILPGNAVERAGFLAVCVTAGACEEILYRGWLVGFLGTLLGGAWWGVLVAGALFGVGHTYQGARGIVTTAALGIVFGAIYVGLGSLVPGQLLHFLVDLVSGFAVGSLLARLHRARTAMESAPAAGATPAPFATESAPALPTPGIDVPPPGPA